MSLLTCSCFAFRMVLSVSTNTFCQQSTLVLWRVVVLVTVCVANESRSNTSIQSSFAAPVSGCTSQFNPSKPPTPEVYVSSHGFLCSHFFRTFQLTSFYRWALLFIHLYALISTLLGSYLLCLSILPLLSPNQFHQSAYLPIPTREPGPSVHPPIVILARTTSCASSISPTNASNRSLNYSWLAST